jgi:molecular chaperone GrpE
MREDPSADDSSVELAFTAAEDTQTDPDVEFVLPSAICEDTVVDMALPAPLEPLSATSHDLVAVVAALGDRLDRRLDQLQTLFDREVRAEGTREKIVDRLHAELQEYKQDLLLNTLRPVFIDLIQLHDDIGKVIAAQSEDTDETPRFADLLRSFQQGIEDILYRQGVEPFQVDGESFDPRRQRAVSTTPTDDPALEKMIAARLRKGFQARDKVVRPEVVSVYAMRKVRGTPSISSPE